MSWKILFVTIPYQKLLEQARPRLLPPVKMINIRGADFHLPEYSHENLSAKLKQTLEHIRTGRAEDIYGWNFII
jgi:hypothetical protein